METVAVSTRPRSNAKCLTADRHACYIPVRGQSIFQSVPRKSAVFDSTIGRWQSKDPKSFDAGDTNLYRYVGNHPSYATDPSGLEEFSASRLNELERLIEITTEEMVVLKRYLRDHSLVDRELAIIATNAGRYGEDFMSDHRILKALDKRLHAARVANSDQETPFFLILGRSNLDAGGWTDAALALRGTMVLRARPATNSIMSPSRGAILLRRTETQATSTGTTTPSREGLLKASAPKGSFEVPLGGGKGILAEIDDAGIVSFKINTVGTDTPGHSLFSQMLSHFGNQVKGIRGVWVNTAVDASNKNLGLVNKLTAQGMSLEEAVRKAWTAEQAARHGFTKIQIGSATTGTPGNYSCVEVIFTK